MADKPELCPTHSDLPETLKVLSEYKQTLKVLETFRVLLVSKSKLAENDYNLSADRYREVIHVVKQTYPLVTLKDICEINPETDNPTEIFGDTKFRERAELVPRPFYKEGTLKD